MKINPISLLKPYKKHIIFPDFSFFLILITLSIIFISCEKEEENPTLGCYVCGTPDRLPASIVMMDQLYVSGEFLDVDNDGDLDFVLGAFGDYSRPENEEPTDRLLLNDGNGYFTDAPVGSMPPKLFSGPGSGATDIEPIDANNDGHLDMLMASWSESNDSPNTEVKTSLQLLINDGTGKFIDQSSLIEHTNFESHHFGEITTADFNGDGLMDFATNVYSWHNTGSGFELGELNYIYKAIADIDGDSLPDLINPNMISTSLIEQGLPPVEYGDMIAFDADSDGDNDLFLIELEGWGTTSFPIKLLLNDGSGKFSYASSNVFEPIAPEFYFADASAADFNGDGLIDIFIQEGGTDAPPYPGGQNRILIQRPTGIYVDETAIRLPQYNDYSHHHAIGDIDNDGDLDIFNNSMTAGDQVSPALLLNDGNGFFTEAW